MSGGRPEPGPPPPYESPPGQRRTLDNGVRVTMVEAGSIPLASVRLVLRTGSAHVPRGLTWLDRFVTRYLAEGTETRDAAALADAIASIGGELDVDATEHTTVIRTEVLAEHAPEAIALLADVTRRPRFDAREATRLLADLRREHDLVLAQPQALAHASFRRALYGDHPYGRVLPDAADMDAITVEAARDFWRDHAGATGAHLLVAGRFDAEAVEAAAHEALADWAGGAPAEVPPAAPHQGRTVHVTDRPGAEQTTLRLGLPVPDPVHEAYVSLQVTNALLGGAFHSRITRNIREEKGYTYSPRSAISARPGDAYWSESADVTTSVTGPALQEIFGEIERLAAEPPSEAELAGIQNYVAGSFVIRQATPSAILDWIEFLDLHGLGDDYTAAYIDRVRAATPADVQRLTAQYLRAEDMTIVAAGDRAAIEDDLAAFGAIAE